MADAILSPGLLHTPLVDRSSLQLTQPWQLYFETLRRQVGTLIVSSGIVALNAPPNIAATSAIGSVDARYAKEDHTHGALATLNPLPLGEAPDVGVGTRMAREDHVHGELATAAPPAIAEAGAVGTSIKVARQDHTHAASGATPFTLTNGDSVTLTPGQPVYLDASGVVKRAQAHQASTKDVLGVVGATIAPSASGVVVVTGVVTATEGEWDAVTGLTGGLVAGEGYFLDASQPGRLVATIPVSVTQYAVLVGEALSSTHLRIILAPSILL